MFHHKSENVSTLISKLTALYNCNLNNLCFVDCDTRTLDSALKSGCSTVYVSSNVNEQGSKYTYTIESFDEVTNIPEIPRLDSTTTNLEKEVALPVLELTHRVQNNLDYEISNLGDDSQANNEEQEQEISYLSHVSNQERIHAHMQLIEQQKASQRQVELLLQETTEATRDAK